MDSVIWVIHVLLCIIVASKNCSYAKEIRCKGTEGESIILLCPGCRNLTGVDVSWFRGNATDILISAELSDGNITHSKDARWRGRADIVNCSLQLKNLSTLDSGLYLCKIGWKESHTIRLHITDQEIRRSTSTEEDLTTTGTIQPHTVDNRIVYIAVGVGVGQIGFIIMTVLACAVIRYRYKKGSAWSDQEVCLMKERVRTPMRSWSRYSLTSDTTTGAATGELERSFTYIDIVPGRREKGLVNNSNEDQGKSLREIRTALYRLENSATQIDNRIILRVGKEPTGNDIWSESPCTRENLSTRNGISELALRTGNSSAREGPGLASGNGDEFTGGYSEPKLERGVQRDIKKTKLGHNPKDSGVPSPESFYTEISEHTRAATLRGNAAGGEDMYDHLLGHSL